ncbi:MAG: ABC transporter permease [Bacillota bacterium]
MFLIKLALKNLTRHKKRTIITAFVISFGIFIFLVSDSLMIGMRDLTLDNSINLQTGHLQVMQEEYWEKKDEFPKDNLIDEDSDILTDIKNTVNTDNYTSRLLFSATINNGSEEFPINAIGIKPKDDQKVFNLEDYMLYGEMFTGGQNVVIGKGLADLMGFDVGDYVTLLFRTEEGTFNTIDAQLTGILDAPHPEINEFHAYLPLQLAQDSLNIGNKVSKHLFKLENRDKSITAANSLNSFFDETNSSLKAYNWEQLSQELLAMIQQGNIENMIMLLIIIVLATVGVINTVILSALERLEEIGMMKALGLKVREIVYIFVIESAGIGIIGSFFGVVIGGIGVYFMSNYGLSVSAMTDGQSTFGIPIADRIYGGFEINTFIFIFFFGIIVSILASILPARWGAKKDPVKAIYHK